MWDCISSEAVEDEPVCGTCREALLKGAVPRFATVNGYVYPPIPKLNVVKERLVADRKKEPASSCTHGKSAKPVQTEASWLFNSSVDVAVETPRSIHVCKSTQASLVAVKVHRWTETTDLVERKDSATYVQEFPAPHVRGMPGLTNMDQSPGVATLYSHQVDAVKLPTWAPARAAASARASLGYEEIPSSHPAALVRPLPSQHRQELPAQGDAVSDVVFNYTATQFTQQQLLQPRSVHSNNKQLTRGAVSSRAPATPLGKETSQQLHGICQTEQIFPCPCPAALGTSAERARKVYEEFRHGDLCFRLPNLRSQCRL
ncbi:hypothetical protein HPB49_022675 [Dermacentor silvarum]|uniref:Uncharacterized protein n=1 Tax=Dermacentor silvarum TaxID=543639 RepID=A0ACB8CHU0_DERSI|nr:hypothetical protein HPB49_022675 [Dermacentor silvarum]